MRSLAVHGRRLARRLAATTWLRYVRGMMTAPAPHTEPIIVTRAIDLDLSPQALWDLVGDGDRWSDWLVDEGRVDVRPGATGTVTDREVERTVRVDRVEPDTEVEFSWWPSDRPDLASTVALRVEDEGASSVLRVVEVLPPTASLDVTAVAVAWEVRAVSAWACSLALARA